MRKLHLLVMMPFFEDRDHARSAQVIVRCKSAPVCGMACKLLV